jgi:hypothetical protein
MALTTHGWNHFNHFPGLDQEPPLLSLHAGRSSYMFSTAHYQTPHVSLQSKPMGKSSNSNGEPNISLNSIQKITDPRKRLEAQNNVQNGAGSSNAPEVSSVRQRLSHHGKESQISSSRSQSNIVQPKSQSSQPSRRAITSLLFFQQIRAFVINLKMTTWNTTDRILAHEDVQTAEATLLKTLRCRSCSIEAPSSFPS